MLKSHFYKGLVEAGCDEAGRGCLAGSVFAAAVILPEDYVNDDLNDSKQLTAARRYRLRSIIERDALAWAVGVVTPEEIDEINILNATKKAMRQAVEEIKDKADLAFVDAVKLDLPIPEVAIIKGDAKSYNIAAASIVAKVYRDRLMYGYAEKYPEYDFASNKGYGTAKHIAALKEYGATPIHRRSFIKNFVNE